MQLHGWDVDDHPNMISKKNIPVGHGVVLWIEIVSIMEISPQDVSPRMTRESGFSGLANLLKVAKHGKGEKEFLLDFLILIQFEGPE